MENKNIIEQLDFVKGLFENLNEHGLACFVLNHINYRIVWESDEKVYRLYKDTKNGFVCEDFFTSDSDVAVAILLMFD